MLAFSQEYLFCDPDGVGWGVTLCPVSVFALVGMVLFLFAWNARATGCKES